MKRKRFQFEESIEVLVGSDEVKFTVPEDLICDRSRFFKSACSEAWNANKQPIKLTDADPQTFSDYLQCVYQSTYSEHDKDTALPSLFQLYILADQLGDLVSANQIMDEMITCSDRISQIPGDECIDMAMESIPSNSPLRRLTRDYYVFEADAEKLEGCSEEFVLFVAQSFFHLKKNVDKDRTVGEVFSRCVSDAGRCDYHQHDAGCPPCVTPDADSDGEKSDQS
ncbi:hypothetical protein LTR37_009659 [Vermiconidia calcicola]|uniref:Uncharacterized protein n=1 Tax=Vermiconidia calcicola TaxID=1690605 RepID=A0ACC3N821_9PEZI|nr:hypothetical protein LTR37_009659 [Vermiconidia calcicola]